MSRSATQTFPARRFPLSVCLVKTFPSHNPMLDDARNCSCSIMMTNEDSLSHAACKRTDTVFSNLRNETFSPNCVIGFLHLRPILLISHVFPSLPILILFMTCAAKRGTNWVMDCHLRYVHLCLFSGNSKCSTLSFHFSHSHVHTTVGHPCGITSTPTHMHESEHLGVLSYSVHCPISK